VLPLFGTLTYTLTRPEMTAPHLARQWDSAHDVGDLSDTTLS
jgi:hypothetical protein